MRKAVEGSRLLKQVLLQKQRCIFFFTTFFASFVHSKVVGTLAKMQKKQKLRASHQARTQKRVLIQLSTRAFGEFVTWKGSWGQGRAFVESKTDACVSNRVVESKTDVCVSNRGFHKQGFLISGDEMAVQKAINMISTQSLTAVASPQDCAIETTDKKSKREQIVDAKSASEAKVSFFSCSPQSMLCFKCLFIGCWDSCHDATEADAESRPSSKNSKEGFDTVVKKSFWTVCQMERQLGPG